MSTRCQLRFRHRTTTTPPDEQPATDHTAQIYRHADGYPESVLPDLAGLKNLLDATRTERGPGYAAAQFILLGSLASMRLYLDGPSDRQLRVDDPGDLLDPASMEHLDQPLFLLGHGVENPATGIHGDEEYLYVVELPEQHPFEEPAEWTVRVSEHAGFPRWDGPTDEAFERATWQFHGSLDDALTELGAKWE